MSSATSRANSATSGNKNRRSPTATNDFREKIRGLLDKGLSVAEASRALKQPERTVRYHAKKSRNDVAESLLPKTAPLPKNGNIDVFYRPHDFTLSLPIHWSSDGYKKRLGSSSSNFARYRSHFVQFSRQTVVVRGAPGFSFEGADHEDAMRKALPYWEGLVKRMEARWGVVLLKPDCEFALTYETGEVGNDLAEQLRKHRKKVLVKDAQDGTTWLTFDLSPGVGEADATHRITAGEDMQRVVAPTFNDLRDHMAALRLPSDSWRMHDALADEVRLLTEQVRLLTALQTESVRASTTEMRALTSVLKMSIAGPQLPEDKGPKERPFYVG